jgi:hypothetical protein
MSRNIIRLAHGYFLLRDYGAGRWIALRAAWTVMRVRDLSCPNLGTICPWH